MLFLQTKPHFNYFKFCLIQRNIDPDNENINKVKLKIGHLSPAHKKDIMAKLISNDKIKDLMKASISNKDKKTMSSSPKRNSSNLLKQYNFSNENYTRNPVIFTNEELEKFNSIMKHPFELLDCGGEEQIQSSSKMFLKSSIKPLINRMIKAPHSSHFSIRPKQLKIQEEHVFNENELFQINPMLKDSN